MWCIVGICSSVPVRYQGVVALRRHLRIMEKVLADGEGFEPSCPEKGKPIYSRFRSTLLRQPSAGKAAVGN